METNHGGFGYGCICDCCFSAPSKTAEACHDIYKAVIYVAKGIRDFVLDVFDGSSSNATGSPNHVVALQGSNAHGIVDKYTEMLNGGTSWVDELPGNDLPGPASLDGLVGTVSNTQETVNSNGLGLVLI